MREKARENHIIYYIFLTSVLFSGFLLILKVGPDRASQMSIVIGLGFMYVLIGALHHLLDHDLVAKIVIEYVLVACLGIAVAFFILKGGFGF